jgi:hypothetical protein
MARSEHKIPRSHRRIGKDAEMLSKRLAEQTTLNQKLITAKLNGEISVEDFKMMKDSISAESEKIKDQINTLDSERSAMQDLMQQAQVQIIDIAAAWKNGSINQKQELVKSIFPSGLPFSHEKKFFEPANTELTDMQKRGLERALAGEDQNFDIGAGDGI